MVFADLAIFPEIEGNLIFALFRKIAVGAVGGWVNEGRFGWFARFGR